MKLGISLAAFSLLASGNATPQSPAHPYGPLHQSVIQSAAAVAGTAKNLSYTIAGTVVDAATGNPIAHA